MLLRMMSSTASEGSREAATPPKCPFPPSSLNGFVINHQSIPAASKPRGPGLPRSKRASTGNLPALSHSEGYKQPLSRADLPKHRASADSAMARASSMFTETELPSPEPDWLETWHRTHLMASETATVPLSEVLGKPLQQPNGDSRPSIPGPYNPGSRPSTPPPQQGLHFQDNNYSPISPSRGRASVAQSPGVPASVPESETLPGSGPKGIPVYVMMPLDTVTADGVFRHHSTRWFHQALEALASSGVYGIAIDVWWGAVERQPEQYDWSGYRQLFDVAKTMNLKIQVVLSFHACGGNVGDSAQIPLPKWVLEIGESDPSIFFTDRPRPHRRGQLNREYISLWADEAPRVLAQRSPLECYTDFMRAFRDAFAEDMGDWIEEIIVGCGPCGELRYASYPETNGWRFPGVGEFQCYDPRALASLAQAAQEAGHPEWGNTGPHDAGDYNSNPEASPTPYLPPLETGFFCGWGGSWDSPYGRFFLDWYSQSLLDHGERLLRAASTIFNFRISPARREKLQRSAAQPGDEGSGEGSVRQSPSAWKAQETNRRADSLPNKANSSGRDAGDAGWGIGTTTNSSFKMNGNRASQNSLEEGGPPEFVRGQEWGAPERPWLRRAGPRYDGKSLSLHELASIENSPASMPTSRSEDGEHRSRRVVDRPKGKPVGVTLKVAGVHWWFRTRAHAAECTAGYFNAGERDGYRDIISLCAKYNATFTLTCVEMCDSQHPPETLCGPEGLLRQVKEVAAEMGVEVGGENALPCFFPMHIDDAGLDRIVYNTQAWVSPLQEEAAREEAFNQRHAEPAASESSPAESWQPAGTPPLPDAEALGFHKDPRFVKSGKLYPSHLPRMRGLTFLRLTQEMMSPAYQGAWLRFMKRMQSIEDSPLKLCKS